MSLSTIPLLGYAPDLDPAQPGVFSYCNGMESTVRGWRLQRSLNTIASASGNPSYGAILYAADASQHIYVAFGTAIYEFIGAAPTSVGSGYTATDIFTFCQYGKYTVMARCDPTSTNTPKTVQIRDSTSTSNAFADSSATGIPKAAICVLWGPPTSPRVMLLNYDDGTVYRDGWWTSHQGGPTLAWTVDVATGAANGRLLGAKIIRCGIPYGDDIIAFADHQMWKGTFIGPPYMVEWHKISDEHGAVGAYAAKVVNGILYFLGEQGLFQYDGTYPRKVDVPIQLEIIAALCGGNIQRSKLAADGSGQRLIVALHNTVSSVAAATKVYLINLLNNKVGIDGRTTWLVLDEKFYATSGSLQQESNATTASNGTPFAASLGSLFGIGLHYIGSNKGDTKIKGVYPRFAVAPSTYSCTDYFGPTASEILSNTLAAGTVNATPWRSDFIKSARWHAPRLLFSSSGNVDVELLDVAIDSEPAGNM